MADTVWQCKVGCIGPLEVPQSGDAPMRDAIARAFRRTIGVDPEFTFSGWSAELTEGELAVVEDRLPDPAKATREVPYFVTDDMARRFRQALLPGFVVWHNGRHLPPADTLEQIKRGLIAALEFREPQAPTEETR